MDTTRARIEPYSPDWFKLRQGAFTASEIYRLMAEPRYSEDKKAGNLSEGANTYILEKVHEKISGITTSNISNYATEWGNEYEPLALEWYAKLTGNLVEPPYLVFHPTIDGFSCTPDSFVNMDGLTEVKCPANGANHFKHCFITNDKYFRKNHANYYWQCMAQMEITGREWCDFVSFDPRINSDLGFFSYRLHFDAEAAALLIDKVTKAKELFNGYLEAFSKSEAQA